MNVVIVLIVSLLLVVGPADSGYAGTATARAGLKNKAPTVGLWSFINPARCQVLDVPESELQEAEDDVRGCYLTGFDDNAQWCGAPSDSAEGAPWLTTQSHPSGEPTRQVKSYTISHGTIEWDPELEDYVCTGSIQTPASITRERTVSCPSGYSGSAEGCTSVITVPIKGPPQARPADGKCTEVGNPCDAATGNKSLVEVDFSSPTLSFSRTYNSFMTMGDARMGQGWSHSWHARLTLSSGGSPQPLVLIRPSGLQEPLKRYPANGSVWVSTTGSGIQVRAGSGGWVAYLPSGDRETYASDGRWLTHTSAGGAVTELTYDGSLLTKVTGPFGHALLFAYDARKNYLERVTDPAGEEVTFTYDKVLGNLGRVTYQDGEYREYLYEEGGNYINHLTGVIDENGNRFSTYDYDSKGRVISSEHAGGIGRVELSYNETTGVTQVTYADGTVETFDFTPNSDQWTWEYSDGNSSTSDEYASMADALAAARAKPGCSYCADLKLIGGISTFSSAGGEIKKVEGATIAGVGVGATFTTDYARRIDTETDANGVTTDYGYDLANDPYHRTTLTEAQGSGGFQRVTSYTYLEDTSNLPAVISSPSVAGGGNTRVVDTQYHAGTRNVSSVTIQGYAPGQVGSLISRTTTYGNYDPFGRPQVIDGPNPGTADSVLISYWTESSSGVACTTAWAGRCGQLKSITRVVDLNDPSKDHVTTFDSYDAAGRLLQMTSPEGVTSAYGYDLRGRLETVTETPVSGGSPRVTTYEYDAVGQLDKVTFPNNQYLDYTWTSAHLLDYLTDNAGHKIDYGYDSRGNRTAENYKDGSGTIKRLVEMAYDARNRLDTTKLGARPVTNLTFDAVGNLLDETNPRNHQTDYQYDPLNRLKKAVDPLNGAGAPTEYGYDVQDNVTSVEAPNGATTTYVYDDLGNLLKETSPDRGVTLYGYDAAGNMTCRADGRYATGSGTCETTSGRWVYSYDALNRVETIDYTDTGAISPDVTFSYDTRPGSATVQKGRLRRVVHTQESVTVTRDFDYDPWGNVVWTQQVVQDGSASKTLTASFEYDGRNQLTEITYPSGRVVEYSRDANGRVDEVTATFNGVSTTLLSNVTYHPFGPPSSLSYGNGLVQARTLDTAYFQQFSNVLDTATQLYIDSVEYVPDGNGNVDAYTDFLNSAKSRDYTHDALDRITRDSVYTPSGNTYSYDANGNRLTRTGTTQDTTLSYLAGSNRIDAYNGTSVPYDGMGNVLERGVLTFDYAASGRLREIDIVSQSWARQVYNGLGELARNRVTADDPCSVDELLLSTDYPLYGPNGMILHMVTENGAGIALDYVWLDELPVAQFENSFDAQGILQGAPKLTYLHADHLGTPRIGTNPAKQVTWRWEATEPFGQSLPTGTDVVRLRFPGQIDLHLGMISYNYFRSYDALLGRYLESDPIGLASSINTYGYVDANPLRFRDPLGLTRLEYDVASGQLMVDPEVRGASPYNVPASSGQNACTNEPKCEDEPWLGPIPRGEYFANIDELSDPSPIGDLARLIRSGGDWGDWRVPIRPIAAAGLGARSGFFLHGGMVRGSAGCIDVGGGLFGQHPLVKRLLRDLLRDPDRRVPISVR